ncbi:MAG TPA: UDP-N-acetylmuramoyl-tripeptide--D-alanyl-D-alanine ligase [Lysobacter sp.]|nr:UDP-N-acetylmuramoyl-tripeptide--D-alanyl-D-alanine ligase [Lysobacter sp.]
MKPLRLSEIARMTGGRLHGEDRTVDALATDTRVLPQAGAALFVALKGARFDGHDHVAAAAQGGVAAALVAREVDAPVPQVVVADTERALADLAAAVQRGRGTKVVAITGSNGKTSVKTLTFAILERAGRAYANPGNRNNEIGLPLAVLEAPDDAEFAVYEMGAGKPGDIAYLCAIARPDVSIVNNIAPAHLERMGSLLGVADTKAAIYDALPPDGTAVINADDAFAPYFAERAHGRRLLWFGLDHDADLGARDIEAFETGSRFTMVTPAGEAAVELHMPGRHNVRNALAAAGLALGLGVPLATIVDGLQAARPVAGRLVTHRLAGGAHLIDDSYNANPGSLAAGIDTLAETCRATGEAAWLVLGDMRELGADGAALHAEAGRRAKGAGIARLFALGELSAHAADAFGAGAAHYPDHDGLAAALAAALAQTQGGVRVLVKGSRGSAMDRIVTALLAADGKGTHHAA